MNFMKDMAYRVNFFIGCGLTVFESIISFAVITIIYSHTHSIAGWSYYDTLILIGIAMISNSIGWLIYRGGLNDLDSIINRGDFDWLLVKPVDTQYLCSINRIDIEDGMRSLVGIGVIAYGLLSQNMLAELWFSLPLFLITFLCGQVVLYSIFLTFKAIAFKSIQGWATNSIAFRFQQLAQYPTDIYKGFMRVVYTYVLPLLFVSTVPAKALTGKLTLNLFFGALAAAVMSFVISRMIWKRAVRGYTSASS